MSPIRSLPEIGRDVTLLAAVHAAFRQAVALSVDQAGGVA